jgi:hypothetical protein
MAAQRNQGAHLECWKSGFRRTELLVFRVSPELVVCEKPEMLQFFEKLVRVMRYLLLATGILFIVALIDWFFLPGPLIKASMDLPGGAGKVTMQLERLGLQAEYYRDVIFSRIGLGDQLLPLKLDTGGYARAQLYQMPSGKFLLTGNHDFVVLDPATGAKSYEIAPPPTGSVYLGAFDHDEKRHWRFWLPNESPERSLKIVWGKSEVPEQPKSSRRPSDANVEK